MKITITLLVFLLFTNSAISQQQPNEKAIVIDSLLNQCLAKGIFNGVALVADNDEIILQKSYGNSNLKNQSPLNLTDQFYIGSITKQFTSILILMLQEEGLLCINDPIYKYIPEFDFPEYQNITIHHLLTHTSGLDSYTSFDDFDRAKNYREDTFLSYIKKNLLFEPGTDWSYSNTGYYLLGIIAQRTGKKTYGALLEEKVFAPLEMHNSSFDTTWSASNVANGFLRSINGYTPMPKYNLNTLFSTGGIRSTAEDLFKWNQALYTNQLLSDTSKSILFTPLKNDYACGWYVKKGIDDEGQSYERHFHGGMIKGYHSFILRRIPSKQVIILLDNSYSQEVQTIKNRIWSALIEEEIRDIKPKLSNLLFAACTDRTLPILMDSICNNLDLYQSQYTFEEFDINTVGYRLMESDRLTEAHLIFKFNIRQYSNSWNVYDSMGELELKQKNYLKAKKLYKESLRINPKNISAEEALIEIKLKYSNSK